MTKIKKKRIKMIRKNEKIYFFIFNRNKNDKFI